MTKKEIGSLIRKTNKLRKRVVKDQNLARELLLGSSIYTKTGRLRKSYRPVKE
jgi:hypothetical protein